jgi:uncharacterized protein (TIGR00299 family) protein
MMKIGYFDCFSGISGDMTVGALLDAGVNFKIIQEAVAKLGLKGFSISRRKQKRCGITGTKFSVKVDPKSPQPHRHLHHILELIEKADLPEPVKADASGIFDCLAKAEAKIHKTTPAKIHFHEVGAVDSIVDIVSTAVGINSLGADRFVSSPVALGSGSVVCQHGVLPVPAPATMELLAGAKVYSSGQKRELVTPTGAAILTHYCHEFGGIPEMTSQRVGYGVGSFDDPERPNLLRILVGETEEVYLRDRLQVIETNVDDMNPEFYDHVFRRLFGAGALDVYLVPIYMKKTRPANVLTVLAEPKDKRKLISIILDETTTFGLRTYLAEKIMLSRKTITVRTKFGQVKVKIAFTGKSVKTIAPEYDDCRRVAEEKGVPVKEVFREALSAASAKR